MITKRRLDREIEALAKTLDDDWGKFKSKSEFNFFFKGVLTGLAMARNKQFSIGYPMIILCDELVDSVIGKAVQNICCERSNADLDKEASENADTDSETCRP